MTSMPAMTFEQAFARMPVIAILRGLSSEEAPAIGRALVEAGIVLMEIPLNTPGAIQGIEALQTQVSQEAVVGAGTVLSVEAVDQIAAAGAQFAVAPNVNAKVIGRARKAGLVSMPGIATATEMFTALDAGADFLKLFPTDAVSPGVVRALSEVAPEGTRMIAVGNLNLERIADYRRAGIAGIGIGRALYSAGLAPAVVRERALDFVRHWQQGA